MGIYCEWQKTLQRGKLMTRQHIEEPKTQADWDNLPQEFTQFLDLIAEARDTAESKQIVDPLYPNCDYDWETDDDIPFQTALHYWNSPKKLPNTDVIAEEITEALSEQAYDDWVSSAYSY